MTTKTTKTKRQTEQRGAKAPAPSAARETKKAKAAKEEPAPAREPMPAVVILSAEPAGTHSLRVHLSRGGTVDLLPCARKSNADVAVARDLVLEALGGTLAQAQAKARS